MQDLTPAIRCRKGDYVKFDSNGTMIYGRIHIRSLDDKVIPVVGYDSRLPEGVEVIPVIGHDSRRYEVEKKDLYKSSPLEYGAASLEWKAANMPEGMTTPLTHPEAGPTGRAAITTEEREEMLAELNPTPAPAEEHEYKTKMPKVRPDHTRYTNHREVKTASGRNCYDISDRVADLLRGLTIEDVYESVALNLAEILKDGAPTVEQLRARYDHLNLGMQRMNLGNLLRAAVRAHGVQKLNWN